MINKIFERSRELSCVPGFCKIAIIFVADYFRNPARFASDDKNARAGSFQNRIGESFFERRHQKDIECGKKTGRVRYESGELDSIHQVITLCKRSKVCMFLALAYDDVYQFLFMGQ